MKRFGNKKLLSVLLALAMVIGMMPTALAACSHNNWSVWTKADDTNHQRTCLTSGCAETQTAAHTMGSGYKTDASNHWKVCSACGAQTTHTAHTYSGTMSSDGSNHWDQCTACGYRDHLGGHVDLNLDAKCDTCGRSVSLTYVSVTFMNGTSTYKSKTNVAKGAAPNNPGTPTKDAQNGVTYTFKGWTTRNPGPSALYDRQTYLTSGQVASTALTENTIYYALFEANEAAILTYEVNPGEIVEFDRSDFRDMFDDTFDDTFRSAIFTADRSLRASSGTLYYDYNGDDEETFDREDLEDEEFYYRNDDYGDYPLDGLSFVADKDADGKVVTLSFTLYGDDHQLEGTLNIEIGKVEEDEEETTITYTVDPDKSVTFRRDDFEKFFKDQADDDTLRYVMFYPDNTLRDSRGVIYYDYDGDDEEEFTKEELESTDFYFKNSRYGDYPLDDLTFVADEDADGKVVTLTFVACGDDEDYTGTVKILIGDVTEDDSGLGDIRYTVVPEEEVEFDRTDFNKFFREEYSNSLRYVTFYPDKTLKSSNGILYSRYGTRNEVEFEREDLETCVFYYSDEDYGDYDLDDLSFVADEDMDEVVTLEFRAWYDEEKYVDGVLTISPETPAAVSGTGEANIRYDVVSGTNLQLNANDFARFFRAEYPNSTLESVKLTGVPKTGALYYNYYSKNSEKLNASTCDDQNFYLDPSSKQHALTALTYVPSGSNYCVSIPFTAYGSGSKALEGSVLIGVTKAAVSEVYAVTTKNTAVAFPTAAIYSAVRAATGQALDHIRLLALPESNQGSIALRGSYVSFKADLETKYPYASGSSSMNQLSFSPAGGYTGSVAIPYAAYDKNGDAIAWGTFSIGVVNSVKRFSDVTSSTWCYKYVTELSDAGVIGGYGDGTYKFNNTITYGAAMKLVMLAAGYSEQAPVSGSHTFSGYLKKAQADGLVSGNVDLSGPITRLQVAQLAAKAMKLSVNNLPAAKPFTDTADVYVQALNAAGIVEGYFDNGTSTYKPGNTLTRGQVSAIVWRMQNYQ